jgi:methionyl-tRNA formyltransferase
MVDVVFMGTPDFAVPALKALIDSYNVVGVVTQPDRPAGRGNKEPLPPPVKLVAAAHGVPVFQPEKLRVPEAIETLRLWRADVYVVAAFGQILPQAVLDIPRHGSINVHASLLPRWRGAAPIQAAILHGDARTGVTIMKMDAGLDTGPMMRAEAIDIAPDETGASLHDKLAELGARLLVSTLDDYLTGSVQPVPQPEDGVTFAPRIEKEQGRIDWSKPAIEIDRQVRAFTPWPGTFTDWNGKTLKVLAGSPVDGRAAPGQVIRHDGQIAVGTGQGLYALNRVQLAGKPPVDAQAFVNGHADFVGAVLT